VFITDFAANVVAVGTLPAIKPGILPGGKNAADRLIIGSFRGEACAKIGKYKFTLA